MTSYVGSGLLSEVFVWVILRAMDALSEWVGLYCYVFFFSSRRRHTRLQGDWSSDVCSSDLSSALPPLATVSSAAPSQQRQRQQRQRRPMTAEEVSSTLARLRRQIADSDYAAVAELERLRPLVSGRHASVLQRIQRCTESLETEAALQALDQLARSMAANRMAPQGAADA